MYQAGEVEEADELLAYLPHERLYRRAFPEQLGQDF